MGGACPRTLSTGWWRWCSSPIGFRCLGTFARRGARAPPRYVPFFIRLACLSKTPSLRQSRGCTLGLKPAAVLLLGSLYVTSRQNPRYYGEQVPPRRAERAGPTVCGTLLVDPIASADTLYPLTARYGSEGETSCLTVPPLRSDRSSGATLPPRDVTNDCPGRWKNDSNHPNSLCGFHLAHTSDDGQNPVLTKPCASLQAA